MNAEKKQPRKMTAAEEKAVEQSRLAAEDAKKTEMVVARYFGGSELANVDEAWNRFQQFYLGWCRHGIAVGFILRWLQHHSPKGQFDQRLKALKIPRATAYRWIDSSKKIDANKRLKEAVEGEYDDMVAAVGAEFGNDEAAIERAKDEARDARAKEETAKETQNKLRKQVLEGQEQLQAQSEENAKLKAEIAGLKSLKAGDDDTFAKMLNEMLAAPALRLADRFIEYLDEPQTTMRGRIEYLAVGRTLAFTINHLNYIFDLFLRRGSFDAADFHVNQHIKDVVEKLMNLQGFREDMAILENTSRASVFAPVVGEEAAARMDAAAAGRKEKPADK